MINNIVLVGRLTRDPELRTTTSGLSVASFTLASDDRRGGTKTVIYIPVSVFGKSADTVMKFVHKGNLLGVTGRLTQRKYTRRTDNMEITSTEIVADRVDLMEPKSTGPSVNDSGYVADVSPVETPRQGTDSVSDNTDPLLEDDCPF
ncbi:MAG: single-stranded DNA-binding protein [Candidatus Enteromonas sp.]|nr:single-stranded DNA-binding protein [Candidatus Enteromonas sp.]MDY6094116.1 single-stranded DNA-binding protein [Candidatus Enteromonas sp.]